MEYVIAVPQQASLAVAGDERRFPVRRIFCVGRNYAAHVREMGGDERDPPFFFCKPADAIVPSGASIPFPPATSELHHEIEMVVAIGTGGANIAVSQALEYVYGYAVGIDLTRRDLQQFAKEKGRPWDMSKGFDNSAPCGMLHPVSGVGHVAQGTIRLTVNGSLRQESDLASMIWNIPETIAHLSNLVALAPGDLIYTGTPDGVGPVRSGDWLTGEVAGLSDLTLTID